MTESLRTASPAPPTMTEVHVSAIEQSWGRVELPDIAAVVRSLASKTHAVIDTRTHVAVPISEVDWARNYLHGLERNVEISIGTTVLYDIAGRMDRWLSTPLPSEKGET